MWMVERRPVDVYLIKFSRPLGGNKHKAEYYLGSAYRDCLFERIQAHASGYCNSKICEAAVRKGYTFEIVRIWRPENGNGRKLEKELKARKNHKKLDPYHPSAPKYLREMKFSWVLDMLEEVQTMNCKLRFRN